MEQATAPLPRNWEQPEASFWNGGNVFFGTVSTDCATNHAPAGRSLFPSEAQHQIVALATRPPEECDRPVPAWSITELTDEISKQEIVFSISRSTVWRLLDQAEIKPHKWSYWLNSPDPKFEEKMLHIVEPLSSSPGKCRPALSG